MMDRELRDFRAMVIQKAEFQLGIQLNPEDFDMRKIDYDPKRYRIAIEFFDQSAPITRFRIYIKKLLDDPGIYRFKLAQDPGFGPTPNDEVYVTEGTMDRLVSQDIYAYLNRAVTGDFNRYDIIVGDDGYPILSDEGDFILY